MSISNVTDQKRENRTFEDAKEIEITKQTVKFGSSVYQFRNVTGFTVGEVSKPGFPAIPFTIGAIGFGVLQFSIVLGIILIIVAAAWVALIFRDIQKHGFILHLNSGEEKVFVSTDKPFLMKIVSTIYEFMEAEKEETLLIDMSNKSVSVHGDFHGQAVTGNRNFIN